MSIQYLSPGVELITLLRANDRVDASSQPNTQPAEQKQ